MKVVPAGQAQPGDFIQTPHGDVLQIVEAESAGLYIERQANKNWRVSGAFVRDSTSGRCAMYGEQNARQMRSRTRAFSRDRHYAGGL